MRAILLAAGVGKRLNQRQPAPKCLLRFGGRTLLARHCENLAALGIDNLTLCAGFEAGQIAAAVAGVERPRILLQHNPQFTLGSSVSLWTARHTLKSGDDVLVMDADVLYDPAILERLVKSPLPNCFLRDRDFAAGDEPVKICMQGTRIVEFSKRLAPDLAYDSIGESVGFFKFDAIAALRIAERLSTAVADGRYDQPHEEALRELALAGDIDAGVEDITGLAWTEIDFPEDLARAATDILPRIHDR